MDELKKMLKRKLITGENEGYEIVITLTALVKAKRITEEHMTEILLYIHGSKKGALRSLVLASKIADDDMIDKVLSALNER